MKLPLLNAKELSKILNKLDFNFIRQHGSHMFFEHENGRTTIIPDNPGEDINRN